MRKFALFLSLFPIAAGWQAVAQAPGGDTSGNRLLNGTYYFRQVAWLGQYDSTNDLQEAVSVYGNIKFDGNGGYTITTAENAQVFDSNGGLSTGFTASGTYSIAASGYGSMDSLIAQGDAINILVSQSGIVVGSSTDNGGGYNDMFVAAPLPSPAPTNSFFNGTYAMIGVDDPSLGVADTRSYSFQLSANGNGGIGTVNLTGYLAANGSSQSKQSISGATYLFSNGAAKATFGGELNNNNFDNNLMGGQKYLYFSPDGNFVFGGSPTGWDFIVGVRQNSGAATNFNGLYYLAGLTQDDSPASASGYVNLYSDYGSIDVLSSGGLLLSHQRNLFVSPSGGGPFDYTYSDAAMAGSNGTYTDSFNQYFFGSGGAVAIGFATGTSLGIEVLAQAPTFSGSGPYIFPTGIVNAGSSAPFTASLAPGELVSIYGTNLTSQTLVNGNLPTTLGDVQAVMVNNTPAPIYSIAHGDSYDQINAVIPLSIAPNSLASVQVLASGGTSNTVTNYTALTAPGVFNSLTSVAAVQHADYSLVTASNPAHAGETLLVYLTGLGQVTSTGNTIDQISAFIGGVSAPVQFSGTQSSVGGGYQMNVQVPSGISSTSAFLDIQGPDSYNSEAVIPLGTGAAIALERTAPKLRRPTPHLATPKARRRIRK